MNNILKSDKLVSGYDKKVIVNEVSLEIPQNKISVILGANASGKSTLLKTLSRLISPMDGKVTLNNKNTKEFQPKEFAKLVGLLPQSPIAPEGVKVIDLVGRGRFPHQSFLKGWTQEDTNAVAEALEIMKIVDIANRDISELSGGQRQRVWIAMALSQRTDILFLDEPTTYLDITYQVEILDLLTDLNKKYNTTIVMVLHDINLSCRYADYLFVMKKGNLIKEGTPSEIISKELIKKAFDLDCDIISDPLSNTPFLIPRGRHHII